MADVKSVKAVINSVRPSFRNDHDKVAFAVHAAFLAAEFTLIATGREALGDSALSISSTVGVGIDHWNDDEDQYGFLYTNPEAQSKKVLVKCLVIGEKLAVDALADGASAPVHLVIKVDDYVNANGGTKYADQYKNLENLVSNVNTEILNKLDESKNAASSKPSAADDGPSSSGGTLAGSSPDSSNKAEPGLGFYQPRGPMVDPYGFVVPPVVPHGGSDVFPGPGAGVYPTRGGFGGGSMFIGPDDPRFGPMHGNLEFPRDYPGGIPGVPPGARFDPIGPPGVPGFEPGRFTRDPRRPPGGTHPDLEHFDPIPPGQSTRGSRMPPGGTHPDLEHFGGGDFI